MSDIGSSDLEIIYVDSGNAVEIVEGSNAIINIIATDIPVGDKGDVTVITPSSWRINAQQLATKFVFNESPSGLINGINATFSTANQFIPESLTIEVNGLRQKLVNDYTVSGGLNINFLISPQIGDSILVNYIKA